MRTSSVYLLIFAASCVTARAAIGCATAKPAEAEGLYLAQHLACVERYATRPAIDACRVGVDVKWGRYDASAAAVVATSSAKTSDAGDAGGAKEAGDQ